MKYYVDLRVVTEKPMSKKVIREILKSLEGKKGITKIVASTIEEG